MFKCKYFQSDFLEENIHKINSPICKNKFMCVGIVM